MILIDQNFQVVIKITNAGHLLSSAVNHTKRYIEIIKRVPYNHIQMMMPDKCIFIIKPISLNISGLYHKLVENILFLL